jgi:hypothetical protein
MKAIIYEDGFKKWLEFLSDEEWEGVTGSVPEPPYGVPIHAGWGPIGVVLSLGDCELPAYQIEKKWEGQVFDIVPPKMADLLEAREDQWAAHTDVATMARRVADLLPQEEGLRAWVDAYEEIKVDVAIENLREALEMLEEALE